MLADARATDSTSEASDVRAIGGILYCALTGFWPHAEAGPAPLPDGIHDNGRLVAPSEVTGDVPAPLDELTMTLLDPQVQAAPAGTVTAELAVLTDPVLDEDLDRSGDHFSAFGDSAQPALANPAHRRRLIGAIGVLVVLALVGAIAALSFGNNSGNGDNSVSPSSNVTTASPAPGDPTKVALSSSNVRIVFGPGQGNRADSAGYQKAFDGNPGTYWQTDSYNDANMKSYHTGIGMLVNLGSPKRVSQVTLNMKRPGATVGLRYGDSDPGDSTAGDSTIDGAYRTLVDQQVMAGSTKIIKVTADTKTQYLLIWCTNLPAGADGGYQLEVGEIEVMVQ
jgi:eukaryotic-like serine/threonine-protein kinase